MSQHDNSIWFTDPAYGFQQGFRTGNRSPVTNSVYRLSKDGKTVQLLTNHLVRSNGVAFGGENEIFNI